MANTNKPGLPTMRPAAGSSSNLQGMQAQAGQPGVPVMSQAMMAQMAATGAMRPNMNFALLQQQQQMALLLQQQQAAAAAAAAGARAPSPAGGQQQAQAATAASGTGAPTGAPAPVTLHQPLRTATGQVVMQPVTLTPEFIQQKQSFIQQQYATNPTHAQFFIVQEFHRWNLQRQAAAAGGVRPAAASQAPPAKRPKMEPATSGVRPAAMPIMQHPNALAAMAMAGQRPPLPPGSMPGMGMGMGVAGMQQITAAQASAAAQARFQASMAQRRAQFPPIVRPASDDERQFVPKQRLQALVKQVGQGMSIANARATEDAEEALRAVAEDFISNAVSFAVSMARRRKSTEVEPADLLLHLERTWNIAVPGFSNRDVKPYQRQQTSQDHQRRMAAVRKAMAAAAASSSVAPAGAKDAAGAAAAGAAAPVPQGADLAATGASGPSQPVGGAQTAGAVAAAAAAAAALAPQAAAPAPAPAVPEGGGGAPPSNAEVAPAADKAAPQGAAGGTAAPPDQQQKHAAEEEQGDDGDMPSFDAANA